MLHVNYSTEDKLHPIRFAIGINIPQHRTGFHSKYDKDNWGLVHRQRSLCRKLLKHQCRGIVAKLTQQQFLMKAG